MCPVFMDMWGNYPLQVCHVSGNLGQMERFSGDSCNNAGKISFIRWRLEDMLGLKGVGRPAGCLVGGAGDGTDDAVDGTES
jgi:hypothetical protein